MLATSPTVPSGSVCDLALSKEISNQKLHLPGPTFNSPTYPFFQHTPQDALEFDLARSRSEVIEVCINWRKILSSPTTSRCAQPPVAGLFPTYTERASLWRGEVIASQLLTPTSQNHHLLPDGPCSERAALARHLHLPPSSSVYDFLRLLPHETPFSTDRS